MSMKNDGWHEGFVKDLTFLDISSQKMKPYVLFYINS